MLKIVLGAEIALFCVYYLFGSFGLQALRAADMNNQNLFEDIKTLENEVTQLAKELDEKKNNPFYKEVVARTELQMAYENEIKYIIPKKDEHV